MSIDWDGYEPYDPEVPAPPNALPRAAARRLFKRCMATKSTRIELLSRLVTANGVALSSTDPAIQALNEWFFAGVEADPEQPGRPLPMWYAVCHDVALLLGDVMIERHPNLRWEFFTWGKTSAVFQQHVIMGFSTEDPKFHTNLNVDRGVSTYGHRIVESHGSVPTYGIVTVRGVTIDVDAVAADFRGREVETDAFRRWLQIAARRA
jgi:hypothetical protein